MMKSDYRGDDDNRSDLICRNPTYTFQLDQDIGTGKWRMKYLFPVETGNKLDASLEDRIAYLRDCMFRLSHPGEHLIRAIRSGHFQVGSITKSPDVRWLEFDLRAESIDIAKRQFARTIHCRCQNSAPYYLPVSYRIEGIWANREIDGKIMNASHEIEMEYVDSGGLPVIKRIHHVYLFPEMTKVTRLDEVVDFDLSNQPPAPERFFLAYYGLPEIFGVEAPKPTPWFLYFSAGGFGLFFLAVFLWRVLAKRQARGVA